MANPLNKTPNKGGAKKTEPIMGHKRPPKQSCSKANLDRKKHIKEKVMGNLKM
jgi:hypothetical protein